MTKEQIKARVCELFEFGGDRWFDYEGEFMTLAAEIAAAEREECAVALGMLGFDEAAAVVRARGNTQRSNAEVRRAAQEK